MKWDESKHPRDKYGKFAKYNKLSTEELARILTVHIYEGNKSIPVTPITEEAIAKVKPLNIPGYSAEEREFISEECKKLLEYARDHNEHNEVAFVYRDGLKNKTIVRGSDDAINFEYALNSGNTLLIIHNHPRNHTFSLDDLNTFARSENIKTMIVVKNNGSLEAITKHPDFDPKLFGLKLDRNKSKRHKTGSLYELERAIHDTLSKGAGGIIWRQSE